MKAFRPAPAIFLVALTLLMAPAAAASSGLAVDDITALLRAGIGEAVILKHLDTNGTRLDLSVEALLALKQAGASDGFLESLMELGEPDERVQAADPIDLDAPPTPEGPFRVFVAETESGERILHLTNLDESGRRIGGEVEHPVSRNVVAERAPSHPAEDFRETAAASAVPPVVVQILPPAPPEYEDPYPDERRREPFAALYPAGRYPGFYGFVPRIRHGRHIRPVFGYPHNPMMPSPPGSYTHFLQFHQEGAFTRGTAAQRNKARFGRR